MGTIDPQLIKIFGFWSSVLALKILSMAVLTARQRFSKKIFSNPEDAVKVKGAKIIYTDPDVERVRRAHLNDLENVLPWFIVTFVWLGTGPSPAFAGLLIRGFVFSRIIHTLVYAVIPQQPLRALSFFVGYAITGYQAVSTLLYYY